MMNHVTLSIDNREVTVEEGTSVFEAARKAGIHIPHLCYRNDLTPFAGCRLCIVEVEGARSLAASCAYPVANKMVVRTDTERVRKARKQIIELLLSDHPYDCMTCEKSGTCKLEKYAYQYGIRKPRFEGEKHNYSVRSQNPFFERDYNKCILCGRCVTVVHEVQRCEAVDFTKRGFNTKIAASFEHSMQETPCVFCGNCVSVCPVGALNEKSGRFEGRDWEMKKTATICSYCGVGCTLVLNTKDNKILKVTSDKALGVNKGWTCVKGRFGSDYVHSHERLTDPLIKNEGPENGPFRKTTWDEALDRVAEELKKVKAAHGPDAIGVLVSAKCTNEENYLLQKLARAALGTNNVDHCARL
jgi:predicted molibdopterin-dependent oxidoreductase YjgC